MSVIEFTKTPISPRATKQSLVLRSFRGISRRYLMQEHGWHFAAEAFFFAIFVAISAWPILIAVNALNEFLQGVPN